MAFTSDKTPEQLKLESKTKSRALVKKAAAFLERVSRKRDTDPAIKNRIKELLSEDLNPMAEAVGPGNSIQ